MGERMSSRGQPAIVVPLDGSRTAAVALGAARALTEIVSGVLHIVHVTEEPFPEEGLLGHLNVEEVFDHIPHTMQGEVVDSILDLAIDIDAMMIVMSTHGKTFDSADILGSKASTLARNSTLPIMFVRPGMDNPPQWDWRPSRILLPMDGTPLPSPVVDKIFDLAESVNLDIDALHIAEPGRKQPREAGSYTSPRYIDRPHYDWPAWTDEFTKRFVARRRPDVKLTLFHQQGDPADVALQFAVEHHEDIIGLSWRGSMEKKHAPTVKGILRDTQFSVLLFRIWE